MTTGELHPSGGDDIILDKKINYYQLSLSLSLIMRDGWVGSKDEATHY